MNQTFAVICFSGLYVAVHCKKCLGVKTMW